MSTPDSSNPPPAQTPVKELRRDSGILPALSDIEVQTSHLLANFEQTLRGMDKRHLLGASGNKSKHLQGAIAGWTQRRETAQESLNVLEPGGMDPLALTQEIIASREDLAVILVTEGKYEAALANLEELVALGANLYDVIHLASLLVPYPLYQLGNEKKEFDRLKRILALAKEKERDTPSSAKSHDTIRLCERLELEILSFSHDAQAEPKAKASGESVKDHPDTFGILFYNEERFTEAILFLEKSIPLLKKEYMAAEELPKRQSLHKKMQVLGRLATVYNLIGNALFEVGVEQHKIEPYIGASMKIHQAFRSKIDEARMDNNLSFLQIFLVYEEFYLQRQTLSDKDKQKIGRKSNDIRIGLLNALDVYTTLDAEEQEGQNKGEEILATKNVRSRIRTTTNLAIAILYLDTIAHKDNPAELARHLEEALGHISQARALSETEAGHHHFYGEILNIEACILMLLGRWAEAQKVNDSFRDDADKRTGPKNIYSRMQILIANLLRSTVDSEKQPLERYAKKLDTLHETIFEGDKYTRFHSGRVGELVRGVVGYIQTNPALHDKVLTKYPDLDQWPEDYWYLLGLIHDIGKAGIPLNIIYDPTKRVDRKVARDGTDPAVAGPEEDTAVTLLPVAGITREQREEIQKHAERGKRMFMRIARFLPPNFPIVPIIEAIHCHHEKFDGTGYPEKTSGENIPFIGRLMAVIDYFDANVSARTYKPGRATKEVLDEIKTLASTFFDPVAVEIVLQYFGHGDIFRTVSEGESARSPELQQQIQMLISAMISRACSEVKKMVKKDAATENRSTGDITGEELEEVHHNVLQTIRPERAVQNQQSLYHLVRTEVLLASARKSDQVPTKGEFWGFIYEKSGQS